MNSVHEVMRYFQTSLKIKVISLILLLFVVAVPLVMLYMKNSQFIVINQHPHLQASVNTKEIKEFFQEKKISEILHKHNVKKIQLTLTDQPQSTFSQTFDDPKNPYISHSTKLENDTLFVTLQVNEKILKGYAWSNADMTREAFLHVFVAVFDLEKVSKEETLVYYKAFASEKISFPFEIKYAN